jgi:hypothetical protein
MLRIFSAAHVVPPVRFAIAACCLIAGAFGAFAQTPDLAPMQSVAPAGKWQVYRNDRYAFEFSYPPDGHLKVVRDGRRQHLRIQNYVASPDHEYATEDGEYDVDLFIFDLGLGQKSPERCAQSVHDGRSVKVGKVAGLRGVADETDDGRTAQALCVESRKLKVLVIGSEADPLGETIDDIIKSVRFGG